MKYFVIHQHHHYGGTKGVIFAVDENEAKIIDILQHHSFLSDYEYTIEFKTGERPSYVVRRGDSTYWFSDKIHVGSHDDCDKCGGTGINHYYDWAQCWKCGERDSNEMCGYARGKGSGKLLKQE